MFFKTWDPKGTNEQIRRPSCDSIVRWTNAVRSSQSIKNRGQKWDNKWQTRFLPSQIKAGIISGIRRLFFVLSTEEPYKAVPAADGTILEQYLHPNTNGSTLDDSTVVLPTEEDKRKFPKNYTAFENAVSLTITGGFYGIDARKSRRRYADVRVKTSVAAAAEEKGVECQRQPEQELPVLDT